MEAVVKSHEISQNFVRNDSGFILLQIMIIQVTVFIELTLQDVFVYKGGVVTYFFLT